MERHQIIERSIITTYRGKIWSKFIKALKEYQLLKENDVVCVCISGGKDSTVCAALLKEAIGKDRVIGVLMPNNTQSDIMDSLEI